MTAEVTPAEAAPPSLWRNKVFNLLWVSQSLSDLGGAIASLAIPLLVLALTGSAVQAGVVATIEQVARLVCRLPAGVLADRLDRRRTMLACDTVRLLAFAGLGAAVATGRATLLVIIVVAVIDSAGGALFQTAEHASLRSIVPAPQLPAAVARNEARDYGTSLAGPPLGGLLFGLSHALPFAGNAVSYLASLIGVALIRRPLQAERTEPPPGHAAALTEGLRFVFGNAFLRSVVAIAAPLNFAITGAMFTIVLVLQSHGTSPAVIGTAEAIIGAGGLAGAFAAPALQSRMRFPVLVRAICWAGTALLATSALLASSLLAAVPIGDRDHVLPPAGLRAVKRRSPRRTYEMMVWSSSRKPRHTTQMPQKAHGVASARSLTPGWHLNWIRFTNNDSARGHGRLPGDPWPWTRRENTLR